MPRTGYHVQGHVEEQFESSDAYEAVTYPICRQVHLVDPDAGRVLVDDERHMRELSSDERNLLRHYAEQDRLIRGPQRAPVHQHLLRVGFIEEKPVNLRDSVICVTDGGRKGLGIRIK